MKTKRINISLSSVAICLSLIIGWIAIPFAGMSASSAVDCPNGPLATDLTGPATGGSTPTGMARYREKGSNQLIVNVRSVNLGATTTSLDVYIGDTKVGTISLRGRNGQLRLDSTTATITEGTVITIRNGTTVVLTGTFACVAGGPTSSPTVSPSVSPTMAPTVSPTVSPTVTPTVTPTVSPTVTPTVSPTVSPTMMPF
jgi:hypothetical protein